jgi:3-phenylpropionate/trans-cinnamate dioxygenase ferredoxin reductase subunit
MSGASGIVIVGAGECGARAALSLRENGYALPVTMIGDEIYLPYERPPLSKQALLSETDPQARSVVDEAALESRSIRHLAGVTVDAIDSTSKQVTLSDGSRLPYDKLLLATGAMPRRLPDVPESPRIFYLRTFAHALSLRPWMNPGTHVAILGGGFIGLEVAASARIRGAKVTLIESQERILKRGVPEVIAEAVHELHRENGVEMRCGTSISRIQADDSGVRIELDDGSAVSADILIVGIGAQPATALAAKTGIALDNGIAVDDRLRTSVEGIFAAGDCCSFPHPLYGGRRLRLEAWRNAQDQGSLAALTMMGSETAYAAVPYFWSDQYDHTLQITGLVDEGRTVVRREVGENAFILFHLDGDQRLVAASGIGPGNRIAKDIRLSEMLIANRAAPPAELLAGNTNLKSLLPRAA